jgi:glycosyltransferase involved in cell wall biosynthesis
VSPAGAADRVSAMTPSDLPPTPPLAVIDQEPPHLVYVLTSPISVGAFLPGQLAAFTERGYRVTVISAPGPGLDRVAEEDGVEARPVAMAREIDPSTDFRSFIELWRTFRELQPTIVNAGTPKAGLLATVVATLQRVPVRLYTLHGLRLQGLRGPTYTASWLSEWLTTRLATEIVAVSSSLLDDGRRCGALPSSRGVVLGSGSCNGMTPERFAVPPAQQADRRRQIRDQLGIPADAFVVGFVGRFSIDKGLADLLDAHRLLTKSDTGNGPVTLLLVGAEDAHEPLDRTLADRLDSDPAIITTGWVPDTSPYYAAMDVLVLPSYREGLPLAPLEAAASSLPVVTTAVTGARDSIEHGRTGILVPPHHPSSLATAIDVLRHHPDVRTTMGQAGLDRVLREFAPPVVWQALDDLYRRLLDGARRSRRHRSARPPAAVQASAPLSADVDPLPSTFSRLLLVAAAPGGWLERSGVTTAFVQAGRPVTITYTALGPGGSAHPDSATAGEPSLPGTDHLDTVDLNRAWDTLGGGRTLVATPAPWVEDPDERAAGLLGSAAARANGAVLAILDVAGGASPGDETTLYLSPDDEPGWSALVARLSPSSSPRPWDELLGERWPSRRRRGPGDQLDSTP